MNQIEDWISMVNDISKYRVKELTEWEEGFIESISERLEEGRPLTQRQSETLHKIWDKVL